MKSAVLALDLGTRLGFAVRRGDGRVESGRADFTPERHEGDGLRFLRFRAWLHDVKARLDTAGEPLGLVKFERVDFVKPGAVYAAHIWGGNWATLTAWCEHHAIPCRGVATATLKKAATGNGRADKRQVIAAMRARGFNPVDDNEADALALLFASSLPVAA